MPGAFETALTKIIDYAGTFPPAKLPIEEAVARFLGFQARPEEAWIVNRFICTASNLPRLTELLKDHRTSLSFPVSVLGAGGEGLDRWESALETDAMFMDAFDREWGERAPIEAFEVRSPGTSDIAAALRDLKCFDHIEAYVEVELGEAMTDELAAIAESEWVGAKARTGGMTPESIPPPLALAAFLSQAIDLDLRFKLTAGLHEPVRHHDPAVGTKLHGFLNVLAACALHVQNSLSQDEFAAILEDDNKDSFAFEESGLRYKKELLPSVLLENVRDRFATFGSCSVDEPLDGLKRLGYAIVTA